jgi:hypothetical protein
MKKLVTIALAAAMTLTASAAQKQKQQAHGYPISPVPFTAVKVTPGTFWGQRLEASRKVTIIAPIILVASSIFPQPRQ